MSSNDKIGNISVILHVSVMVVPGACALNIKTPKIYITQVFFFPKNNKHLTFLTNLWKCYIFGSKGGLTKPTKIRQYIFFGSSSCLLDDYHMTFWMRRYRI